MTAPRISCCDAEREVLWVLNGHCNSPIAGYSTIDSAQMSLTASVLDEAGDRFIEVTRSGPSDRPRELGRAVGSNCSTRVRLTSSRARGPSHEGIIWRQPFHSPPSSDRTR